MFGNFYGTGQVWLGGSYDENEEDWKWTDGSPGILL